MDPTSSPDANGSGSGWAQFIGGLGGLTNSVIGTVNSLKGTPKPATVATPVNWAAYLPWAIGGVIVIALLVVLSRVLGRGN